MPRDTPFTTIAARVARLPFSLRRRRQWEPPGKIVILKPCCLSQVMLATPLLAAVSNAYPEAQIDWALCAWARSAVATNPRLSEIVDTGLVGLPGGKRQDVDRLVETLRGYHYDTAFIPSRSSLLAYVAWRAGIPQRVGLNVGLRGFAHTFAVRPPSGPIHEADLYMLLARAIGLQEQTPVEFYPRDVDRSLVSDRLVAEVDWLGERPLAIVHPGGGHNPVRSDRTRQWPPERFALLGNYLARQHQAAVVLVGDKSDQPQTRAVRGFMTEPVADLTGALNLGELAALSELADLYVGNDAGSTHVAAAVRCPTIAIFGPSDPTVSRVYAEPSRVMVLSPSRRSEPFTWDYGPTYEEAVVASDILLSQARVRPAMAGPGSGKTPSTSDQTDVSLPRE